MFPLSQEVAVMERPHENGESHISVGGSSTLGWVVSFVLFPFGPFVYLAVLRVITVRVSILLLLIAALVHFGMISILIETNEEPWQPWLVLLLGAAMYLLGTLQFLAGDRKGTWGPKALRHWRSAGWVFGMLLALGLLLQTWPRHKVGPERPRSEDPGIFPLHSPDARGNLIINCLGGRSNAERLGGASPSGSHWTS